LPVSRDLPAHLVARVLLEMMEQLDLQECQDPRVQRVKPDRLDLEETEALEG
jgi:hypothetical protein